MEINDKVLCIKNLEPYDKQSTIFYEKNKYYKITDICYWTNKTLIEINHGWAFMIKEHINESKLSNCRKNNFIFEDYFYDIKKIRKLKLTKLNETKR